MLEYDDVRLMMFLIERSETDDNDDSDWKIRVWWWWYFDADIFDDDDVDVLMMFMIEILEYDDDVVADRKAKVLKKMLLIERSKCWRWCCQSKGQSAEDVADQSGQSIDDAED